MSKENTKILVFIAGPYTGGDVAVNVRTAILIGSELIKMGCVPVIPHLSHFHHMLYPQSYDVWLEQSTTLLKMCDCVIRIPGVSPGADRECAEAKKCGIPVYAFSFFRTKYKQLRKLFLVRRGDIGKTPVG